MTNVVDPRSGRVERALRPVSREDLDALGRRLRAAQPLWLEAGDEGRAAALTQWAAALESAPHLRAALIADTGRETESVMETTQVAAMARRWAAAAPALLRTVLQDAQSVAGISLRTGVRPYCLVGVISPWNFPLLLGLIDAIPALAAGCAVLIKPSEVTPRFIKPLTDTLQHIPLLRDVVGVVEGAGDTGTAMIGMVDAVCFTGSVPTGRKVARAAAEAFIPAFLELGGKDPAIVLPGTELGRASSALLWGSVANAGQSCLSIERVYAHRSVHDELVDLLAAKAAQVTLAWPRPGDGMLGPLIDPEQAGIIVDQLADAVAQGAVVRTGGIVERLGGGHWIRPTVLTQVHHGMTIMREETFGPILPVMPFDTTEEAIELANDSEYGLSAAVFGPDVKSAQAVARQLNAGAVSVNDAALTALIHDGEKNSFGSSGLGGSRMGPASLRRFVRRQTLITNISRDRSPWWHTP